MKQERKNWHIASICLTVIMLGILFYFLTANLTHVIGFFQEVNSVLTPIYAGGVLAFLLSPIHEKSMDFFQNQLTITDLKKRKKISNGLAIFVSLNLTFFVFYLLISMLLPELYLTVENLFSNFSGDLVIETPEWLGEFFLKHPDTYEKIAPYYEEGLVVLNHWIQAELSPAINSVDHWLSIAKTTVLPNLMGVVSGFSQVLITIFVFIKDLLVAVIVCIYLLAQKNTFIAQSKKMAYAFLPEKWAALVLSEFKNAYRIMSGFINGKMLDSLIIGIITLIACHILDFPYAILIATVIGITNIIPFFGPFIGGVPCGVLIFFVSPVKCLYFIVFIVALQQFDGNILGPKILGDSTGLSSFWVLFAIILFGGIFGIGGMILGVPIFATFYSIMSRWIKFLLEKKDLPVETAAYGIDSDMLKNVEHVHVDATEIEEKKKEEEKPKKKK